jgi:hypothetical protein
MSGVTNAYVLPRCTVGLYTEGSVLLWTALSVENLRVSESYDFEVRKPTGIPYPDIHPTTEHHELTFDAIWNISAVMGRTSRILVVVFRDGGFGATTKAWVKRVYYGVLTARREVGSREGNEFTSGNTLQALYYTESTGTNGEPTITP